MSGKKKIGIAVGSLLAVVLAALGIYKVFFAPKGYTQNLTDPALGGTVVADYTKDESVRTETFASGSKGYSWENGDPFNVWWRAENAVYANGKLTLTLSEMTQKEQVWASDGTSTDCLSEYYGSEVRSEHYYGYGDFQVRMKPAAIPGTASTFFTCTGPYDVWYNADGSVQRANDHDEIDIEFLGKDTTKVQFNYFASGKGGHEYMYDLGFDASKDFHNYGYRWSEESITWFVDDEPVYKVLRSEIPAGEDWPEDPGRIVMNYWCGTANAALWMGTFQDDYSSGAEYEWAATSAAPQPDPSSTKPAGPDQPSVPANGQQDVQVPDTQWAELDLSAFDGWGKYTVTNDGGKVTISHDKKLQKYDCCGMDVNLGTRNKVSYTVTNAGSEKAFAKVSIKNTSVDNSAITSATINGGDAGYYEYGVLCELAPGESADVVMLLDLGKKPSQMVVSVNSETDSEGKAIRDDMPKTGKIVISELQAVKSDETALPGAGQAAGDGEQSQQPSAPKAPEGPATEWAELDLSAFDGWGKYTVAKASGKVTISHDKKLQKYDCCGMDVNLGTRNKVSYTVTNAGSEKAYAKVSIKNTSADNSAITSATINGGDAGYYEYGVLCELDPGESADVVMLLDLGKKPSQMVVSLNSEADSEGKAIRDDMPKTGKVVISDLKAVKSVETALPGAAPKTQQPGQDTPAPAQPQQPDVPATEWAALDLSAFDGWGKYTVAKAGGAITVSHDKAVAMYDCCGVDIALGERNKVQFSLTNNGAVKAFAKVNVKDRADSTGVSSIRAAAVNGVAVDYVQYGVLCELEPGQTADVEIYVDGVHPADQLVVSLNSEADSEGKALRSDMPQNGSVILSNLRAVKADQVPAAPEQPGQPNQPGQPTQPNQPAQPQQPAVPATEWAALDLSAFDGWGKYTVAKADGAITVSHDKAVAMYDCCGGEIALGSRNKVKLTLTNNGAEKAYAKVNINDKAVTTGVSSIASATVNGADAGYIEYGVLCELPAGESAQVELLTAPGKTADQLIISLNSEGDSEGKALRSDMPKSGKITVSNVQAIKTDETTLVGAGKPAEPTVPAGPVIADGPLDQWADVDLSGFDGWGSYTVEKTAGSMTMSHDKALKQYACGGMSFVPGERNKVKMTITNNGDETAQAKVSIKSDTVDKSAIMGAKVDGKGVGNVEYGVMCKVPAGKSVELVVFLNLKKDVKQFVVSLNSEKTRGMPTSGSITISGVQAIQSDEKFTLASSALSGGGGGGGGGGSVSTPPAKPDSEGKLDLNSTSGSGWNTSAVAESTGDGGVKLSHSKEQGVYGNYSWPIDMGENNKLELDVVNNGEGKAYAKVSLTTEGDDSGVSVLESATVEKTAAAPALLQRKSRAMPSPMRALLRAGGPQAVDDVLYGVMCELEPGESAHVVMFVKQEKLAQANKLVVSLNSEGNETGSALREDMPASGSITLKNIVCRQAEAPEPGPGPDEDETVPKSLPVDGFEGWGKYTVTKADGAVTVSHDALRAKYDCCGVDVTLGTRNKVTYTVTNNGSEKAFAKVSIKNTSGDKSAITSATIDGAAVGYHEYGVLCELEAGASADVVMYLDLSQEPTQLVLSLNSEAKEDGSALRADMPATGSVTLSNLQAVKSDEPAPGPDEPTPTPTPGPDEPTPTPTPGPDDPEDDGLTDMDLTTLNNAWGYAVSSGDAGLNIKYNDDSRQLWMNVKGMVDFGNATKMKFTIKNNLASMGAIVRVKLEKATDINDNNGTPTIGNGKVTIDGEEVSTTWNEGLTHTIPAGKTAVYEINIDQDSANKLVVFLNSVDSPSDANITDGDITITSARWNKTAEPGPGPEDDGLTDMDLTTLNNAWGYAVSSGDAGLNIKYNDDSRQLWMNVKGMVDFGNATKMKFTIKNNLASMGAIVRVKLEKATDINDNNGTPTIGNGKVTIDGEEVSTTWNEGLTHTIPAGKTAVYEINIDQDSANKLVVFLNSVDSPSDANITDGDITITSAKWNKTGAAAAGTRSRSVRKALVPVNEVKAPAADPAQPPAPQPNQPPATETVQEEEPPMAAPPATPPAEEKPEEPVTDKPIIDEPVTDKPVIDEPVANEPVVDEPVADKPVTDKPVVDKPVVDKPVIDEPVVDEPVTDKPVIDEPVADEPVADEPVTDKPVIDEPVADEPAADEPVTDKPVTDKPVVDEPLADEEVPAQNEDEEQPDQNADEEQNEPTEE